MMTVVLLLTLLISGLSLIMTIGNALSQTALAKFWALLTTLSVFTSSFVFMADSFDLLEVQASQELTPGIEQSEQEPGKPGSELPVPDPVVPAPPDSVAPAPIEETPSLPEAVIPGQTPAENEGDSSAATSLSRIVLLDLFAKNLSGKLDAIPETQREWLIANAYLFPPQTTADLSKLRDNATEVHGVEQINRNFDNYRLNMIVGSGQVLDTAVSSIDDLREMQLHVITDDGGVLIIYYPERVDVASGERIKFYGVPVVSRKLQDNFFGEVSSVLLYASHISR